MPPSSALISDQKTFNRKFREHRLAAEARGLPFPSYQQALKQLGQAMDAARRAGEIADVNAFWDYVFRPSDRDRERLQEGGRGRKASQRQRAQALTGRAAEAVAVAASQKKREDRIARKVYREQLGVELDILREQAPPKPKECEICGREGTIVLDHCHATGAFRGWLCHRCNLLLGSARDNPELLRRLAKYLDEKKRA